MNKRTRIIISAALKYILLAFAIITAVFGFFAGWNCDESALIVMKLFSAAVNASLGLFSLIFGSIQLKNLKFGKYELSHSALVIQLMLTMLASLAGFVFCLISLSWQQALLGIVILSICIVDLLAFTRSISYSFKKTDIIWTAIPAVITTAVMLKINYISALWFIAVTVILVFAISKVFMVIVNHGIKKENSKYI